MNGRRFLFVGPTLHRGLAARLVMRVGDWVLMPPVRRGDIHRLIETVEPPGTIGIADGYFHLTQLSVGHAELRAAIERGWLVWGLASMGAIRACEMRTLGMHGFGRVYQRYADDGRFRDDEVTLIHEPTPPYRAFSEPLFHIRAGLDALVESEQLTARARDAIVDELAAMWFGERTLARAGELLGRHLLAEDVTAWLARFDEFQVKSQDLAAFLAETE